MDRIKLSTSFDALRSYDRWRSKHFFYEGIDAFLHSAVSSGMHTIVERGIPIDLHLEIVPSAPLVVILNGNMPRSEAQKLPVFSGLGILPNGCGISRVCVSDPTLNLAADLNLGWYGGSKNLPFQRILPLLLSHVFFQANPTRVAFAGGSAGGFASLFYGSFFAGSLIFVWNPQTDLLRYNQDHVRRYAATGFGIEGSMEEVASRLPEIITHSVIERHIGSRNYILYLQNRTDWHFAAHLEPFLHGVSGATTMSPTSGPLLPWLHLHLGEWGNGHVPPPKALIGNLLKSLMLGDQTFKEVFSRHGLTQIVKDAECEGIL